jgi:hypothetical protein
MAFNLDEQLMRHFANKSILNEAAGIVDLSRPEYRLTAVLASHRGEEHWLHEDILRLVHRDRGASYPYSPSWSRLLDSSLQAAQELPKAPDSGLACNTFK